MTIANADHPTDLRTMNDEDLVARYGCDRFTSTILSSRLHYVVDHVCASLLNNAFSPIIRDFHDFTATLSGGPDLDYETPVVAQTLPVFFGSMRDAVANVVEEFGVDQLRPGDVLLCNDTFRAGTHPNDMCLMRPVFAGGKLAAVLTIREHMLDIGGSVPGGFSGMKRDIYENGLIIPPMLLFRDDQPVRSVFSLLLENTRFGQLMQPDLHSTFQALRLGEGLISATIERYGLDAFEGAIRYSCDASAERGRRALRSLPDGSYQGTDDIDCDGLDPDQVYRVAVTITKTGDRAEVDLSGTSEQARTSLNSCWPDVKTAVSVALKSVLDPASPFTSAWLRHIDIVVPGGTIVTAEPPFASMLYWEPILSIYSATIQALNGVLGEHAQATPARGTHLHSATGGPAAPWFAALNPIAGWGANSAGDADSGQTSLSMNFIGVDCETVEADTPVIHLRKEYVADSGGPGVFRGGAGTSEDTLWLNDTYHVVSASRTKSPNGRGALGGGDGGMLGLWFWADSGPLDALLRNPDATLPERSGTPVVGRMDPDTHETDAAGTYFHWSAQNPWVTAAGAVWRTRSDGGGGWGDPLQRDPAAVARDVRDGYVSVAGAERDYGVVVTGDPDRDPESVTVDVAATAERRAARDGERRVSTTPAEPARVAPTKYVERQAVDGRCPECGAQALQRYPVLAENGWIEAVKCGRCLYSVSRTPAHRLGTIHLLSGSLAGGESVAATTDVHGDQEGRA